MTADTTSPVLVAYVGRRLDGKGRLFHLYRRLDDQGQVTDQDMGFSKPLHLAQRPGVILAVTPADDGKWFTRGDQGPTIQGALDDAQSAGWDAQDRATWNEQQRKRSDVAKAREATDLRAYLAPIHDAYVNLNPQARTAFLADVIDAVIQPRFSR